MHTLSGFEFEGIDKGLLDVDRLLASPLVYDQGLMKYIRHGQSFELYSPLDTLERSDCPIKIEGMERLNETMYRNCRRLAEHFGHDGPVSAHLFISSKDSVSFPMHTDPDDVIIYMVEGSKIFEFEDGQVQLEAGDTIHIPRNKPHRAINIESSMMLSFGLELFWESKL